MSSSESSLAFLNELLPKLRARGFDSAEVVLDIESMTEMQVDAGEVSLLRDTKNAELTLRGIAGGRYAAVALNQLDDKSVNEGLAKLEEAAKSAPVDEARVFASKSGSSPAVFENGPKEPSLDAMFAKVDGFVSTVGKRFPEVKLEQSGLRFERERRLRANTNGLQNDETESRYSFGSMFSARRGDKISSFNYSGANAADLERDLIQFGTFERLLESSVRETEHVPLKGKFVGPLVITPDCLFEVIGSWLSHLSDDRLISGTSRLREKLGQAVTSAGFTLRVDPTNTAFAKREYTTGEGFVSEPSTIVENGVLKSFMLSNYGARKTGLERSKNSGLNRVIDAGNTPLKDLIGGVKQGILLGRFSGGVPAANGDFSGVAKNSYKIENGVVTTPVSEVMIAGNLFSMMSAITGISKERVSDGTTLVPWMVVDGITITGT